MNDQENFIIIDFDGWNIGTNDDFRSDFLEFDSYEDCLAVAIFWDLWINKNEGDE